MLDKLFNLIKLYDTCNFYNYMNNRDYLFLKKIDNNSCIYKLFKNNICIQSIIINYNKIDIDFIINNYDYICFNNNILYNIKNENFENDFE